MRDVETHNARVLWKDAASHFAAAKNSLEVAQGILEDLSVLHLSENVTPIVEAVDRFLALATDKAHLL